MARFKQVLFKRVTKVYESASLRLIGIVRRKSNRKIFSPTYPTEPKKFILYTFTPLNIVAGFKQVLFERVLLFMKVLV